MSDLPPPPYVPHPPGGPSAPGFPPAFSSQPSAFPGSPYQTFPQTYTCGGDHSYYQGPPGPPGPLGPPEAYLTPPGYQGFKSGPPRCSHPWDDPKTYGELPKNTVFVVEQNRGDDNGGGSGKSCLAACSAALCFCCLWDMLTHNLC